MRRIIIGVMGPGDKATDADRQNAYQLGQLIAQQGWVLLTGGRSVGVMDAANQGAKVADGLTVGILPTDDNNASSEAVDIAVITNMGDGRNNINVLSSHVVIACGMGAGTASEVALALKGNKKVILLNDNEESKNFFKRLSPENVYVVNSPGEAIDLTEDILAL